MNRGTTLVEVMVSVAICVFILAGVYMVFNMGTSTYSQESHSIYLQQAMRSAMNTMAKDFRAARLAGMSDLSACPNSAAFNTPDVTGIQYYLSDDKLIRQEGTSARALCGGVTNLTFCKAAGSKLLTIQFTAQKEASALGRVRTINATLEEKVRLRND